MSPDIVYEDMVYESPVVGAEALRKFLGKFNTAMSGGLAFVIDDISEEDTTAAGLIWVRQHALGRFGVAQDQASAPLPTPCTSFPAPHSLLSPP